MYFYIWNGNYCLSPDTLFLFHRWVQLVMKCVSNLSAFLKFNSRKILIKMKKKFVNFKWPKNSRFPPSLMIRATLRENRKYDILVYQLKPKHIEQNVIAYICSYWSSVSRKKIVYRQKKKNQIAHKQHECKNSSMPFTYTINLIVIIIIYNIISFVCIKVEKNCFWTLKARANSWFFNNTVYCCVRIVLVRTHL